MEDPKTLIKRFVVEVLNQGNLDALGDFVASDVQDHSPRHATVGFEGVEGHLMSMQEAFPDLEFHVDELVAEGDLVSLRGHWSGTHKAIWLGVKPTGLHVTVRTMEMYRMRGGKIVERWAVTDEAGVLQQLGVLPSPESN